MPSGRLQADIFGKLRIPGKNETIPAFELLFEKITNGTVKWLEGFLFSEAFTVGWVDDNHAFGAL